MNEEIKKRMKDANECPFCGEKAYFSFVYPHRIYCSNVVYCGFLSPISHALDQNEAVEELLPMWNAIQVKKAGLV